MQTILGSGGAIASILAKELLSYTDQVRLVSRNPKKVNSSDELFSADLSKPEVVSEAITGSEVVYLTVGFVYSVKIWRKIWPPLVKAVIDACEAQKIKLVFFDNVYIYDRDYLGHMTEETPIRPTSKKGEVRTQISTMILEAVAAGRIQALIARSADFYGPNVTSSLIYETVVKNLTKGKKANWFADDSKIHSCTYTPDAAKATALLGNTPEAYNQVWHLPTSSQRLTGKDWVKMIANDLKVEPKSSLISNTMLRLIGIFVPVMREFPEMSYQYDRDYFFDSSKFTKHFGIEPTSYEAGIREMLRPFAR